jgi:imidazolonepropionase-like amidohydrolase
VHDLGDVSLLPGLIDAHFHMDFSGKGDAQAAAMNDSLETRIMRATDNLRRNLLVGLTTLRDLGARNEVTFPITQALAAGVIPGPRLIVAGAPITISSGHCWFFSNEADTLEEVVKAVRKQVRLGSRVIKVMASGGRMTPTSNPRRTQYEAETLRAVVNEAERAGLEVAAHTLAADGVRNCVQAGVHHIVHGKWYHRDPSAGLDYDHDAARRMAAQGQWLDPTIGSALLRSDAEKKDPALAPALVHWGVGVDVPLEEHLDKYRRMHDAGVRFTAGLDGGDLTRSTASSWAYREMLGWDAWQAIRSATADNAEALGLNRRAGFIRPGMDADLAAFKGDPAANIRDLGVATTVVQMGRVVKLNGESLV